MSTERDAEFAVERLTVQDGRTFSADALDSLGKEMVRFLCVAVLAHWDTTGEPPTAANVKLHVSIQ